MADILQRIVETKWREIAEALPEERLGLVQSGAEKTIAPESSPLPREPAAIAQPLAHRASRIGRCRRERGDHRDRSTPQGEESTTLLFQDGGALELDRAREDLHPRIGGAGGDAGEERLATARLPGEHDDLARRDREGDPSQADPALAERTGDLDGEIARGE
jgi:hypothetical protein